MSLSVALLARKRLNERLSLCESYAKMTEYSRKEEKYDIRKLRQELGAGPVKYDYSTAGPKTNASLAQVTASTNSRSNSPSGQARQRVNLDPRMSRSKASESDLEDTNGSDRDLVSTGEQIESRFPEISKPPIAYVEKFDATSGDEVDESDLTSKFFGGFRDMYSYVKSTLSIVKKQSRSIRNLEYAVRELQIQNDRKQDDIAILGGRCKELEIQMVAARTGDPNMQFKMPDGKDFDPSQIQTLFHTNASNLNQSHAQQQQQHQHQQQQQKKAKDQKAFEQEIKEALNRIDHQISDIHLDLSKKQVNLDKQSFMIHTVKEKLETIDVREDVKDIRKQINTHAETVRIIQGQVETLLADTRIEMLEKNLDETNAKVASLQSKLQVWYTDLFAQFEALRQESSQHKSAIYEKLYERVREDISRQTSRCFKELKVLSDHCQTKFEEFDEMHLYVRDEVPRKLNKEDLVDGFSDAELREADNFRALLVTQLLRDIQETFDINSGFNLDELNQMTNPNGERKKDPNMYGSRMVEGSPSASPVPAQLNRESEKKTGRDIKGDKSQQLNASPSPIPRQSPAPQPMTIGDATQSSAIADELIESHMVEMVGSEDTAKEPQKPSIIAESRSPGPESPKLRFASTGPKSPVPQGATIAPSDVMPGLVGSPEMSRTEPQLPSQVKAASTAQAASHLQSVLTKFYGVLDFESSEQLRTLVVVLIQKIQRLQAVLNLKLFRHEARIEFDKKLNVVVFEQALSALVNQLRHQKLDITLDIPQLLGLKGNKAHTSRNQLEKGDKMPPIITPARKGNANRTQNTRKEDLIDKNDFLPLI